MLFCRVEQKEFLIRIGSNIDRIRKKKNLTVQALANGIEVERSNLVPILKGKNNVTALTLYKLAKFLDVDPKEFFL